LIVVVFLAPLAVYCIVLGMINRRQHPLMVSARWDFVGLIFAASGFLVFFLPGLLSGFTEHGRTLTLFGRPPAPDGGSWGWLRDLFEGLCATLFAVGGSTVLLAYFALVVAGCGLLLWRRRNQTAVYNVHADVLDEVLTGVLDAGELTWWRAGNRYFIARSRVGIAPLDVVVDEGGESEAISVREHLPQPERRGGYPASAEDVERTAYLELEAAPSLCHVTLRWETEDGALRNEVEQELVRALREVRTRHNAAAAWLLAAGTILLFLDVMIFVWVAVATVTSGR
jgi:hypothetical protein